MSDLHPGEVRHADVGTTVETVELGSDHQAVVVLKRTTAGELFVRVDSDDAPVVDGDDSHCLPEGIGELRLPSPNSRSTIVKLVASAGTVSVSVTGLRP